MGLSIGLLWLGFQEPTSVRLSVPETAAKHMCNSQLRVTSKVKLAKVRPCEFLTEEDRPVCKSRFSI